MSATAFAQLKNNLLTTLGAGYTAGAGSLALASGAGAAFGTVSPTSPVRFTVITAASYGTSSEVLTIFLATGRTGDTLTGVTAAEGTTDRNYALGDKVEVRPTEGAFSAIHTAVNTLESATVPNGVLKGVGGALAAAVAGTDFVTPSGNITGSAGTISGTITESQVISLVGDLATLSSAVLARLVAASNLSDLTNTTTARANLGVAIGSNVQAWDADLDAIAAISTTGILAHTGAGTAAARTITGTAGRIAVTSGDGASGNPTLDIDGAYVGQTSITTVGTITSGTWTGTAIAIGSGGTGQTTATAAFAALSPLTTKGDLLVYTTGNVRLAVGTDGQVMTADSTQPAGVKWATNPSVATAVESVAASDSPKSVGADFTCTGSNDETQINQAIDALRATVTNEAVTSGTFAVVNTCEATTNWTAVNSATVTADAVVFKFGTHSIKVVPDGAHINPGASIGSLSINATTFKYLSFWVNIPDPAKLLITITTSNGSYLYETKASDVNTWVECRVPLNDAHTSSGTLASVTAIAFSLLGGNSSSGTFPPTSQFFYIDQISFVNPTALAHGLVHDGSVVVKDTTLATTYTEGTDYEVLPDLGWIVTLTAGAITSAQALKVTYEWGGGTVVLRKGTYVIGTTGIGYRSYTHLDLRDGAKLMHTGTSYSAGNSMIHSRTTARKLRECMLSGGELVGNRDDLANNVNVSGVYIANFTRFRMTGTTFVDFNGHAYAFLGLSGAYSDDLEVTDCFYFRCGADWVDTAAFYNSPAATNPDGTSYWHAVELNTVQWGSIRGSILLNAAGDAMVYKSTKHCSFTGNVIRNCRMGGLFCDTAIHTVFSGNMVDRAGSRGVTVEANCTDTVINGNTIQNSGRDGLWIHAASLTEFAGNIIDGANLMANAGSGSAQTCAGVRITAEISPNVASFNTISNNIIKVDSAYCAWAILVDSTSGTIDSTVICNNSLAGTQKGLSISAGCTNTYTMQPLTTTGNLTPEIVQSGGNAQLALTGYATDTISAGVVYLRKARGFVGSAGAVVAADRLGTFLGSGYNGSAWNNCAAVSFYAQAVSTNVGGEVRIESAPTSSTTRGNNIRANALGTFITLPTSAPADAALSNNEMVFWNNGGVLSVKMKNNSGVVTNGTITTA